MSKISEDNKNTEYSTNRQYKNDIFRYLFMDGKNFVSLYKEMTGIEMPPEDIEFFDTSSILFVKEFRNDVSFLRKDGKFFILMEHQSSISGNMAIRLLIYYVELLKIYIKLYELNLFSTKAQKIPSAEFLVAYNGMLPQEDYVQEINLNFLEDTGDLKVKVHVKNINYDHIKSKDEKSTFTGYSFFMDQIRKNLDEKLGPEEAFMKAKKECMKKGLLIDYLNRKEFVDMYTEIYTVEQEKRDLIEETRMETRKEAKEEGIKEGIEKVASNLLKSKLPVEQIVQYTGLSKEEVMEINKRLIQ